MKNLDLQYELLFSDPQEQILAICNKFGTKIHLRKFYEVSFITFSITDKEAINYILKMRDAYNIMDFMYSTDKELTITIKT